MHARTRPPPDLVRLAAAQEGLFTTAQAARLGVSQTALRRNRLGAWRSVGRGLWQLSPWEPPAEPAARAMASARRRALEVQLTHPSAGACDDLAAELRGWDGHWSGDARRHVAAPSAHRRRGWRARPDGDLVEIGGVRLTDPWRTLLDLAEHVSSDALELCVESAARDGVLPSPDDQRWSRAPRSLRHVMDRRGDLRPTESMAETLFVQLVRHLPDVRPPDRQVEVRDHRGRFVARVDFAWPELRLCVEVDGRLHDATGSRDDARTTAVIAATGWTVVVLRWEHLTVTPHETLRRLRRIVDGARMAS